MKLYFLLLLKVPALASLRLSLSLLLSLSLSLFLSHTQNSVFLQSCISSHSTLLLALCLPLFVLFVAAAIASGLLNLATLLKKDDIMRGVLPVFATLLKDAQADVRLNVLSKLHLIKDVCRFFWFFLIS